MKVRRLWETGDPSTYSIQRSVLELWRTMRSSGTLMAVDMGDVPRDPAAGRRRYGVSIGAVASNSLWAARNASSQGMRPGKSVRQSSWRRKSR
jgi:hypothetical protein